MKPAPDHPRIVRKRTYWENNGQVRDLGRVVAGRVLGVESDESAAHFDVFIGAPVDLLQDTRLDGIDGA